MPNRSNLFCNIVFITLCCIYGHNEFLFLVLPFSIDMVKMAHYEIGSIFLSAVSCGQSTYIYDGMQDKCAYGR